MFLQMNIKRKPVIQRGNLTIDPQCCTVTLAGEEISLYPKEFDVLFLLTQYPGWVLSPEQIYGAIWKESEIGCERVVYNVICQLRRKLKNPDMIQTVIGRGYKFVG
ncbi:MAG: winged helix-turn-helix domain-containing protein [Eubacteriales bacterium]|nr:winged helix-turn-helix domain-containing protein [Eubacteriales bacterium]